MREKPLTRPTIVAANELLAQAARTHTEINKLVLRLGLEAEIPDDNSLGIEKKCDRLGRIVLARADDVIATVEPNSRAALVENPQSEVSKRGRVSRAGSLR